MSSRLYPSVPRLGACTAIWRNDKILLAKRTASPNEGTWAMPGGMVEVGETLEDAAIREVKEETALEIGPVIFNRFHQIIRADEHGKTAYHYVLAMFVARSLTGTAIAGDDAAAVEWFSMEDMANIPLTSSTEVFARESLVILGNAD